MTQPPRIELARLPTPLQPLDRFSAALGGPRIWIKRDDMTDTPASGNKLRKLEFSVGQALREGADVLVTCGGVQSNHCRATAIVASRLGLASHLILRGKPVSPPDGNVLLDELVGARLEYVTQTQYEELDALYARVADEYRAQGMTPFIIPVGASDEIGLWGYITACEELKADFERLNLRPGYLFSAAGSGGTLGGLIIGRQLHGLETQMVAFNVCDDEAWFNTKIANDIATWQARYGIDLDMTNLAINIVDGYVGPGYGRADPHVFDTIRTLAKTEGLILDPVYTGKAFDAMVTEIRSGRFTDAGDVVFLHTGGIYGLFPQRDKFWEKL
ncbi:MAG: D-cysteine desulfhydrase family protein [Pseudomonadales bacterium]|nr:D-cysteine desulfhydrase family protein [Pseudomonadales bacterium]